MLWNIKLGWLNLNYSSSKPLKERDWSASPYIRPTACYIPPASTVALPVTHCQRGGEFAYTLKIYLMKTFNNLRSFNAVFWRFYIHFNKSRLFLYVLVVEVILRHAGSEKLLLHLQYWCLLSAQPLLLGVLHIYKPNTLASSFSTIQLKLYSME